MKRSSTGNLRASVAGVSAMVWILAALPPAVRAQTTGNVAPRPASRPAVRAVHPQPPGAASQPARAKRPPAVRRKPGIPKPTVVLEPGQVPAIELIDPVWEFGRVRSGEKITHTFTFKNTGNGPLEILKVKPG